MSRIPSPLPLFTEHEVDKGHAFTGVAGRLETLPVREHIHTDPPPGNYTRPMHIR
jgi:hypothetical protein